MSQVASRKSQVASRKRITYPKFPLYKNDGRPSINLNELQKVSLKNFIAKLESGEYTLEDNPCMCGAENGAFDVVITEKDRYGLHCEYVLCMNCGLVRQRLRLDDASTGKFYRDDYRNIYVGQEFSSEVQFDNRINNGKKFYSLLEKNIDVSAIKTVFETGCADGGILYAFYERGKEVSGCDYGEKYLQYGRDKGLNLYSGEPDLARTPANSQDLVILSHVMEHLNNPLEFMNNIIEFISPNGYLLIQLPGLLAIDQQYGKPVLYFQNAHVNNFYAYYLEKFFTTLGLEVIYGDEVCTFILRKPEHWHKRNLDGVTVWDETMPGHAKIIADALKKYYIFSKFNGVRKICRLLNSRRVLVKTLELLGVKELVKKMLGRK